MGSAEAAPTSYKGEDARGGPGNRMEQEASSRVRQQASVFCRFWVFPLFLLFLTVVGPLCIAFSCASLQFTPVFLSGRVFSVHQT